jgi:hypothetical protein
MMINQDVMEEEDPRVSDAAALAKGETAVLIVNVLGTVRLYTLVVKLFMLAVSVMFIGIGV